MRMLNYLRLSRFLPNFASPINHMLAMPEQTRQGSLKSRLRVSEPDHYHVVMLNDDFTPMDFVVEVLRGIFFKSDVEAEILMLRIHREGEAVVGTYTFDIAETKARKTIDMAHDENYPLRVQLRKA